MSTTISYKGATLATVNNDTKTLETQGKYMEADVILTDTTPALPPAYAGATTVTPTENTQTLPTAGKTVGTDITVNPIPSNYYDTSDATIQSGAQLFLGVTVYGPNGKVTGTLSDGPLIMLYPFDYGDFDASNYYFTGKKNLQQTEPFASTDGQAMIVFPKSLMGNTQPEDVVAGKIFTSEAGIQETGTLQAMINPIISPYNYGSEDASTYFFTGANINLLTQQISPFASTDGKVTINFPKSLMGDAQPEDVTAGKIFTSAAGIQAVGTRPASTNYGDLLATESLGTIQVTSTSAISLGISKQIPNCGGYDLLAVVVRRDSKVAGYHLQTLSLVALSENSTPDALSGAVAITSKENTRCSPDGDELTYSSTTAYGVYAGSVSRVGNTVQVNFTGRYDSTFTRDIDGSYTMKAYGIKYRS